LKTTLVNVFEIFFSISFIDGFPLFTKIILRPIFSSILAAILKKGLCSSFENEYIKIDVDNRLKSF